MLAVEKLDKNGDDILPPGTANHKLEEENSQLGSNDCNRKVEPRVRKEREDEEKYLRLYEKFRSLNEKLNRQEEQIILI